MVAPAILGFIHYKTAEALSPRTIVSYEHDLKLWLDFVGDDPDVASLEPQGLRNYLAWLRTDYKPHRFSGDSRPLAPKTIRNSWVSLSAFFTWISVDLNITNPMKTVAAPRFEEAPVEPFTREQIEALVKVCDFCHEAQTRDRRQFTMRRSTAKRDRAIILTLLDTGLRASELCSLKIGDVDQTTGKIQIKHGRMGGAKGGKGRTVYLGKAARRTLWHYLSRREDGEDPEAPLFVGKFERGMNKDTLRQLTASLGRKAGVPDCHPHRFRHTFAITYLRSGGDVFTLQALLGHSSLDMVQHYARIAEIDVAQAHRRASPADNWRL